jgi:hypothetical protein
VSTGSIIQVDNNGYVQPNRFDQLAAGDYFVEFTLPASYTVSPLRQGGNDAFDSDADASTNFRTPVVTLALGEDNRIVDFGLSRRPTFLNDEDEPGPTAKVFLPLLFR